MTKVGYSDASWTTLKLTYTYYDNTNNRLESKTLAAADANGNIYYHYIDEAASRMDKSKRSVADADGCLSYTYTYSGTTTTRVIGKVGYSDASWTTVKVTYVLFDTTTNRMKSKTLAAADASGNIYYEFLDEDYASQGFGRLTKSRPSVVDSDGCLSYSYA